MPNFWTHIKSGFFAFPILVLGWQFLFPLLNDIGFNVVNGSQVYLVGFAFFVLGTDLPDIDHKDSLINKFTRIFLMGLMTGITFLILNKSGFVGKILTGEFSKFRTSIFWFVSVLIGLVSGEVFLKVKPSHRGLTHSLVSGFLYSVIVGFFVYILSFIEGLFFPIIAAFSGYLLHMGLDKFL